MFCHKCGAQLADDARFCGVCGAQMNAPEPAAAWQPLPLYEEQPAYTPKPKKRKKKFPIVPIVAAVTVVALVIVLAVVLLNVFGKQTVYVKTSTENYNRLSPSNYTYNWEYDEEGNLLRYERVNDYTKEYEKQWNMEDVVLEIQYAYEDGRIIAAELSNGDESIELEYVYNDEGLLEEIVGEIDDGNLEAECNSDGLIESIVLYDEDGEPGMEYEFAYHDNGIIAEREQVYNLNDIRIVTSFNEDGKLTEQTNYYSGEKAYHAEIEYDDWGNMTRQVNYDANGDVSSSMELEYTYDKNGKLTGLTIIAGNDDDEAEIECEVEYDGLEMIITLVDIDGSYNGTDELPDDTYILVVYDEAGNMLEQTIYADDEVQQQTTWEYMEVKVPKDYREPSINDPLWFMFLV